MGNPHMASVFLITCVFVFVGANPRKATNYDHYTKILTKTDIIRQGLRSTETGWTLNNRPFKILSGSIHYFRIHPDCWRDRLKKLRAAGANTVDTTIPWNLHMLERGHADFGKGFTVMGKRMNTTMTRFLDVVKFIEIAKEEDLFVIVRVGPYVGADLDLGGIPSWFLLVDGIHPRSNEKGFVTRMKKYYDELLPLLMPYGFSGNGEPRKEGQKEGHIIAYQVDHEYASKKDILDSKYLEIMVESLRIANIHEMVFMADKPSNPGVNAINDVIARTANLYDRRVLRTASLDWSSEVIAELQRLKDTQPKTQLMVSEFRANRVDRWMQKHSWLPKSTYRVNLERILDFPASVNIYMFSAGTNWGFIGGASVIDQYPYYQSVVTSYDNDAPLNEAGEMTPNYFIVKELFERHGVTNIPWSLGQENEIGNKTYPSLEVTGQLGLDSIVAQTSDWWKRIPRDNLTNMENIARAMDKRHLYGYVLYRSTNVDFAQKSVLKITGRVHDVATVIVDGKTVTQPLTDPNQLKGFGYWNAMDAELHINSEVPSKKTLDILVESLGRVNLKNYDATFNTQKKGIYDGPILVDGTPIEKWESIPLDLIDEQWVNGLADWKEVEPHTAPTMYKATFDPQNRHDSFLDMRNWGRGVAFINGFNLGRYHSMGPTRTLYLPAPFLVPGENTILVFEIDKKSDTIDFTEKHIRTAAPFSFLVDDTPENNLTLNKHKNQAELSARYCCNALVMCVFASFYWSLF